MKRSKMPARTAPIRRTALKTVKSAPKNTRLARSGAICGAENGCEVLGVPHKAAIRPGVSKRPKKLILRAGGIPQNLRYLAFIRSCPCILFNLRGLHECSGRIEAAHTGRRGRGQKAADETALPMCCSLHRTGKFSHHVLGRKFWEYFGLDREKLVREFNECARLAGIPVAEIPS